MQLRLGILVRNIANVQDHIRLDHLFQRGTKSGNQHGRQIGNKADRIGENDACAMRKRHSAQRWVERREQHIG